jgi:hypothetical protein
LGNDDKYVKVAADDQIYINVPNVNTSATSQLWTFDTNGDLTLPAGGDIKNSSGTSVLSNIQGEYIHEFDGVNTDLTIANVNFNLLFCTAATGYIGTATHNVNLPNGTPGQRLVIINISNNCTLTIAGFLDPWVITSNSGPAEFIFTSSEGWFPMYGIYTGP